VETIITIRKNKPAYKALILLARELEKSDKNSISIVEKKKNKGINLIAPVEKPDNIAHYFEQLIDYPSIEEVRNKAWPKNS
jgi:hypothetical protein